jgi:hypothetical protein
MTHKYYLTPSIPLPLSRSGPRRVAVAGAVDRLDPSPSLSVWPTASRRHGLTAPSIPLPLSRSGPRRVAVIDRPRRRRYLLSLSLGLISPDSPSPSPSFSISLSVTGRLALLQYLLAAHKRRNNTRAFSPYVAFSLAVSPTQPSL